MENYKEIFTRLIYFLLTEGTDIIRSAEEDGLVDPGSDDSFTVTIEREYASIAYDYLYEGKDFDALEYLASMLRYTRYGKYFPPEYTMEIVRVVEKAREPIKLEHLFGIERFRNNDKLKTFMQLLKVRYEVDLLDGMDREYLVTLSDRIRTIKHDKGIFMSMVVKKSFKGFAYFQKDILRQYSNLSNPYSRMFWEEVNKRGIDVQYYNPVDVCLKRGKIKNLEEYNFLKDFLDSYNNSKSLQDQYSTEQINEVIKLMKEMEDNYTE